jgi:hypothetical protein
MAVYGKLSGLFSIIRGSLGLLWLVKADLISAALFGTIHGHVGILGQRDVVLSMLRELRYTYAA